MPRHQVRDPKTKRFIATEPKREYNDRAWYEVSEHPMTILQDSLVASNEKAALEALRELRTVFNRHRWYWVISTCIAVIAEFLISFVLR